MEPTSQAAPTTAQVSSPTPIASVPSSVSSQEMSAPSQYQASQPQAPAVYQTSTAPAPAGNPWQEAFQALSASLNTPSQSLAQVPSSAYQTPTPQVPSQVSWASTQAQPQAQYSEAQTYQPQASTQAFSAQDVQSLLSQQAAQLQSAPVQSAPASDSYLSQISDTSLEVLEHFGAEAPALLNNYACAVEDALIEQVKTTQAMNVMLNAAGEERAAMNVMLTDPDILADYVNEFFGAEGPYPTETPQEAMEREQIEAREQFESEIEAQEQRQVPQNFQRPQMEMPTPGQQSSNEAANFWGNFSEMMDNNPENAWQYLSGAAPAAFQQKMMIQDV